MAGFFLYISNTTCKDDAKLCFHEIQTLNTTPSEDKRINCSTHGRYVFYYNERKIGVTYPSYYSRFAYYELCELKVYGKYGNKRTWLYILYIARKSSFFLKIILKSFEGLLLDISKSIYLWTMII